MHIIFVGLTLLITVTGGRGYSNTTLSLLANSIYTSVFDDAKTTTPHSGYSIKLLIDNNYIVNEILALACAKH